MSGKNLKGGKNFKKTKTRRARNLRAPSTIDVDAGEGYYAKVKKLMGDNNVMLLLHNGKEELGTIPGRMIKRVWIKPGFLVLVDKDKQIEEIIRPGCDREADARKKLGMTSTEMFSFFDENEEEDDGEDIDMKLSDINRSKPSKEKLKEQNINRQKSISEGRHFTDPLVLQKTDLPKPIEPESDDDDKPINIDDI